MQLMPKGGNTKPVKCARNYAMGTKRGKTGNRVPTAENLIAGATINVR